MTESGPTVGHLHQGVLDVLRGQVDGLGARLPRERQALRDAVDGNDALGAQHQTALDREHADRPAAPDRHSVLRTDVAVLGSLVGSGEDVTEKQDLLVGETLGHHDGADVGIGYSQVLGLTAGDAAGEVREAEQSGERIAEDLGLHRPVRVGALAAAPVTPLALPALATADGERHHDAVADLKLPVVAPDLDDLAHGLVPEDVAALHRGHEAAHKVKVRAADRAGGHLDDDVTTMLDLRVRHSLARDLASALPSKCLHFDDPAGKYHALNRGKNRSPPSAKHDDN